MGWRSTVSNKKLSADRSDCSWQRKSRVKDNFIGDRYYTSRREHGTSLLTNIEHSPPFCIKDALDARWRSARPEAATLCGSALYTYEAEERRSTSDRRLKRWQNEHKDTVRGKDGWRRFRDRWRHLKRRAIMKEAESDLVADIIGSDGDCVYICAGTAADCDRPARRFALFLIRCSLNHEDTRQDRQADTDRHSDTHT